MPLKGILRTFSHFLKYTLGRAEHSTAKNDPHRVVHHMSARGMTDCNACPSHGDSVSKGKANNLSVRSETSAASDGRGSFWRLRQEHGHVSERVLGCMNPSQDYLEKPCLNQTKQSKRQLQFLVFYIVFSASSKVAQLFSVWRAYTRPYNSVPH